MSFEYRPVLNRVLCDTSGCEAFIRPVEGEPLAVTFEDCGFQEVITRPFAESSPQTSHYCVAHNVVISKPKERNE